MLSSLSLNRFPIIFISMILLNVMSVCRADPPNDASVCDEKVSFRNTAKIFSAMAKEAIPAVVFISVEQNVASYSTSFQFNNPFDLYNDDFLRRFFGHRFPDASRSPDRKQMGWGSGFIISKDGYILTNHHVVGQADKITIQLNDGRVFEAANVGADPKSDVAILKIDNPPELPVIPLGSSKSLEVGEWVMAIGNPFGLSHTLTVGIVSAKGRTTVGISEYEDFIQTDAAINPGNSGGPLINLDGEAVGINTAIFSKNGGDMGIGFAIPIDLVKTIKDQLLTSGKVSRGFLGVSVQDLTKDHLEYFGLERTEGVLVVDVNKGSPAEKVGMERGDVILKFEHKTVKDVGHFRNLVAMESPGSEVHILILRKGKHKEITAKLGSLDDFRAEAEITGNILDQLGFTVQDLTMDIAQKLGYADIGGVLISDVELASPAHLAGMQPGMLIVEVNRKTVASSIQFAQALEESKKTKRVLILFRDKHYAKYIIFEVN